MQQRRGLILLVLVLLALAVLLLWVGQTHWGDSAKPDIIKVGASRSEAPKLDLEVSEVATKPIEAAAPATRDLIVSGGQAVRLTSVERVKLLAPPYGAVYNRLRPGAEKADAHLQYQLGKLLYECRYAPEDETRLLAEIDALYQTRRRQGWDVRDPEQEAKNMRQTFENCQGVPAQARGDYRDWMRLAADAGLVEAQLNLMFHLPRGEYCQFIEECSADQVRLMEELREEAREQVGLALAAGTVEALRLVGSWALNDEMGLINPISAYAHLSAYDRIQQALGAEREVLGLLDSVRVKLRPVDIEQAEAEAAALLSAPNCCIWIQ